MSMAPWRIPPPSPSRSTAPRSRALVVWPGLFWVVDQAWPLFCRWRQSVWSCVAHPPAAIHPLHRCAGSTEPLQSQQNASPGTHAQLEAQSQGDFETAGRNSVQIKSLFIFPPEQGASMQTSRSPPSCFCWLWLTCLLPPLGKLFFFPPPAAPHLDTRLSTALKNLLVNCALRITQKWLQFQALLNWENHCTFFFSGVLLNIYCLK